jgi:multiple sugar transport system permease protein
MSTVAERVPAQPRAGVRRERPSARRQVFHVLAYAVLIAYSIFVFLPFLWTLITSFKTLPDSLRLTFIPQPFTFIGYEKAFTQLSPNIVVLFLNSVLLASIITVTNVILAAVGGYAFARLRFPGREILFLVVLGSIMIPDQLRLVPVYQMLTALHLVSPGPENYLGIVLILAVTAQNLFIMRQYFLTIPYDLEESAKLDGAGFFTTFSRIMLPLAQPALAAVAILAFQGTWNQFFWPLVILQAKQHWTLPLGLTQFRFLYNADWPALMAVTTIATVPIVFLYVFFQRYFVGGLVSSAVKG